MRRTTSTLLACLPALLLGCSGATPEVHDGSAGDAHTDVAEPRSEPTESPVLVATWNVHRLFDTTCDSGSCGGGAYEALPSEAQFEARVASIALAIEGLGADVVALQEIENQASLDAVAAQLGEAFTVAVLGEHGSPATVDVAVVARGGLVDVRTHRDEPLPLPGGGTTTFARELLEVHLDLDGQAVVVFAAHFRSKYDDDPARRIAEATAARELVAATAAERPEALVLLAGDLNDTPGSEALLAIEEGGLLDGLWDELPADEAWTWAGGPDQKHLLDHLVVGGGHGRYVFGSAVVLRDEGAGTWGASDHAAVRASFTRVSAPPAER